MRCRGVRWRGAGVAVWGAMRGWRLAGVGQGGGWGKGRGDAAILVAAAGTMAEAEAAPMAPVSVAVMGVAMGMNSGGVAAGRRHNQSFLTALKRSKVTKGGLRDTKKESAREQGVRAGWDRAVLGSSR